MKKLLSVVLVFAMLLSTLAPFVSAQELDNNVSFSVLLDAADDGEALKIIKTAKRTNFPISEATGANSKLFMLYDTSEDSEYTNSATLDNYIVGIDYASSVKWSSESGDSYVYPTGVLETDKANSLAQYTFVYAVDAEEASAKTTAEFTTKDGKTVWTMGGVDYFVNPEEKVIQLFSSNKTTNIADADIAALFTNSMKGVTLDVEDGYYDKIGFLAASGWGRTFTAVLNYEDGSNSKASYSVVKSENKTVDKAAGNVALKKLADKGDALRLFQPCEIAAEPSKKLVSVTLTASTYHGENPVNIISAWGSTKTIEEKLAELESVEITDKESLNVAKAELAEFDAFLEGLGYTLDQLGSYKAPYTNLKEKIEKFEKDADKNEVLSNKYTQLEMVGPWDMFATGDDIKDANWKVTSTAAAPNLLAYKGWQQSSSGNIQPSASNLYAFRADMMEGTAINKNTDGRYYINVGSVPFKLGEIKTTAGERGTNGWIPRGKLTPNTITEGLIPDIATTGDVTYAYGTGGYATNIMQGTFNINKENTSAINFLTTGVHYGASNNKLYDVYVKYEGEEVEEHGFMFAGNLSQSVEEAVFAIPASEYDKIMADESLTKDMRELETYTVDEINALRGYTSTSSVDTSKTITSKNYTLAQFNEALGLNLSKVPTAWIKDSTAGDTTFYDLHKQIVATTKYNAVVNGAVALNTLNAGLDTKKLSSAYTDETVAIPTESGKFVKYRRGNWNSDYDTIVSYTKYPLDPNKKVESVRVEANLTDIKGDKGVAVGSGGVYSVEEYNTGRGVMLLNYNGQKTVNINGTEYVLFMKIQRECGDSMFLGATYERKSTIKEEIDGLNERLDAVDENTKVAEILAIRENIESLKAESTYVTDEDFNLAKLTAAEATLSDRKVVEATKAMQAITIDSSIEAANEAKDLYDYALEDANVTEASFDTALVALFNEVHAKIADKINLKGTISVKYFKGEAPSAEITIENATKFAGKPYKVIFMYYDAEGNLVGKDIQDRTSAKAEKEVFTLKATKDFENAVKVKAFIWKDFGTILPLSNVEDVEKKSAFKILSIGNSFSVNAHTYLGEIVKNAGFEKIIIENLYIGGCTLDTHYSNLVKNAPAYTLYHKELVDGKIKETTTKDVTMLQGIKNQDWDVITIQQGSSHSAKPDKFTYLQDIIDYVNENKTNKDAKIAWHMTWSYKDDSENLQSIYPGMTQMDMYNGIVNAVQTKVLTAKGIDFVIPAGTAVQNARVPLGDTMNSDNIHLNNVANYMVGLLWFEKITGIDLNTITFVPDNATIQENEATLKKAAKDALSNPYDVTK